MSMGKMMVSEARLVKRLGLRPHVSSLYGGKRIDTLEGNDRMRWRLIAANDEASRAWRIAV